MTQMRTLIDELSRIELGMRVLDIGAGRGTLAREAVDRRARVFAIDIDPSLLISSPGIRVVADACRLPFRDERFDLAMDGSAMVWVKDRGGLAREAFRVLRPGAALVGSESLNAEFDIDIEHEGMKTVWRVIAKALVSLRPMTLTRPSLESHLRRAGFTRVSIEMQITREPSWDPSAFFFEDRGPGGFSFVEYLVSGGFDENLMTGFVNGLVASGAVLVKKDAVFRAFKD